MSSFNNSFTSISSTSDTSSIQQKSDAKNNNTSSADWKSFASTIPTNLLHTFFFVLIGASLIFYGEVNKIELTGNDADIVEDGTALYKFFPSNPLTYFEKPAACEKNLKSGDTPTYKCGERKIPESVSCGAQKFGIGKNAPYIYGEGADGTVDISIQGLKNWFAESQAGTWSFFRGILAVLVTLLNNQSDSLQIILGGLLMYLFVSIVLGTLFPGMILTIINQITSNGGDPKTFWSPLLFTFFPGFLLWLPNAIVMLLNTIFSVTLLPLFVAPNIIKDILVCNHKLVGLIFGFMMAGAGSINLDTTVSSAMWLTWVILLCLWIWKG